MRSLVLRKFWNKFFYSKIVFIIFVLLSFYIFYKCFFIAIKYIELRKDNNFLSQKTTELEQKHKEIQEKLNFIQTERGIEQILREDYNLSKINEREIVMHKISPENDIIQEINNITPLDNYSPNILDYIKYFLYNYTNINIRL